MKENVYKLEEKTLETFYGRKIKEWKFELNITEELSDEILCLLPFYSEIKIENNKLIFVINDADM